MNNLTKAWDAYKQALGGTDTQKILDTGDTVEVAKNEIVTATGASENLNRVLGTFDTTAITAINKSTEESAQSFDEFTKTVEDFNKAFDNAQKVIDSAQSEVGSLNKTIESLNENQSLSVDEMLDLIQKYPQLSDKITQTSDGYTIETGVLEVLRQAKIDEYETAIRSEIEKTKQTLESSKSRLSVYKIEIGAIKDLATAQAEVAKLGGEKFLKGGLDSVAFDDNSKPITTCSGSTSWNKEQYEKIKSNLQEQIKAKKSLIDLGGLYESLDLSLNLLNNVGVGSNSSSNKKGDKSKK